MCGPIGITEIELELTSTTMNLKTKKVPMQITFAKNRKIMIRCINIRVNIKEDPTLLRGNILATILIGERHPSLTYQSFGIIHLLILRKGLK